MVASEELGQTILVVIFAANTALQGSLVVHEGGGHVDVKMDLFGDDRLRRQGLKC